MIIKTEYDHIDDWVEKRDKKMKEWGEKFNMEYFERWYKQNSSMDTITGDDYFPNDVIDREWFEYQGEGIFYVYRQLIPVQYMSYEVGWKVMKWNEECGESEIIED